MCGFGSLRGWGTPFAHMLRKLKGSCKPFYDGLRLLLFSSWPGSPVPGTLAPCGGNRNVQGSGCRDRRAEFTFENESCRIQDRRSLCGTLETFRQVPFHKDARSMIPVQKVVRSPRLSRFLSPWIDVPSAMAWSPAQGGMQPAGRDALRELFFLPGRNIGKIEWNLFLGLEMFKK